MHFPRRLSTLLLLALVSGSKVLAQDSSVKVSELLKEVQKGLNDANSRITNEFRNIPPLDSVSLQLQTEVTKSGSGGFNIWFIKIGGGIDKSSSTQMVIVLKPAKQVNTISNDKNLDQTISDTLYSAAKGISDAQIGAGSIPLKVDALSADFAFTVKKNASGGVQFTLAPVGGSASGSLTGTDIQKVTIKFATGK